MHFKISVKVPLLTIEAIMYLDVADHNNTTISTVICLLFMIMPLFIITLNYIHDFVYLMLII